MPSTQFQIAGRVAELLEELEERQQLPEGAAQGLLAPVAYVCASVLAEALAGLGAPEESVSVNGDGGSSSSPFVLVGDGWEFQPPRRGSGAPR